MRILFINLKTINLVTLNFVYYVEKEVEKIADCKWSGKGWKDHILMEPLSKTIKRLYGNDPPDWVVSNIPDLREYQEIVSNLKDKEYNMAMTIADLHVNPKKWVEVANSGFDVTFMRYLHSPKVKKLTKIKLLSYFTDFDPFYYVKNLKTKVFHLPCSVDSALYNPKEEKIYDVVFLGAFNRRVYPLRYEIVKELPELCEEKNWRYILGDRPPGHNLERFIQNLAGQGYYVGNKYADVLSSCKILIFGSSIFRYPLSKYFEGMASGALVMADKPTTADALHFKPGWNFVEINRKNWKEKLDYYITNDEEREKIAHRGYETVMKYHTSSVRAKQLVSYLREAQ